ncbi:prolyl oligopeptidase family serine peptidase [Marinifilum sp. N1E240]|uniref:S9 family peptidase n=1 Tax=Marinifilum sp. N1E240 TaxID=2608082 RepID=UPI00128E24A4|nr:DPP IV N-terminal domain-containing protein [Marinifilum sp. N1E240]MPQ47778.1 prolyl oligopeptidase family serine peptidase [Marinifilum sp. N1E240]
MKRFILLSYLLINCGLFLSLQAQPKNLSMEDAILGQWRQFYPENLSQLSWKGESNLISYAEGEDILAGAPGKEAKSIFTLTDFNTILKAEENTELKRLPRYRWINSNVLQFRRANKIYQINIEDKNLIFELDVNSKAENEEFCQENKSIAYTIDNNLYIANKNGEVAVTSDSDKNIVNGQAVSRSEYGINGGIFWGPQGDQLAFYSKDESKVSSFPIVDINTRVGDLREIKYPMCGMDSEAVKLGVFNLKKKSTTWIKPDDFGNDQYLTNISWGANGQFIYIQVLNRESNHMKMNKYIAETGEFVQTLFEEMDNRWVEPSHQLIFMKNKPNQFIYQTNNRDGFNHAYLYNTDGKLVKQLTSGDWEITEILGFDKAEKNLFYVSTEVSPLDRHVYKLNLKSGKRTRLTNEEGYHSVQVSADGKYIIDNYSSLNVPRKVAVADTKGKQIKELINAENKLKEYNLGEISLGSIKSADGQTDLHYRMVKPANFDPNKKYPVVVYVYGGPHAQLVTNRWMGGSRLWEQYMAQNGYLLYILDNRGSANRGKEFEAVIHRQCGQPEMADQMKGVEFLQSLPYVDADRIGVHGWSYGGFMTISLLTNYPDVFKVGVAGGPVIDWKWYEVMYGERYMDTPQENPEGYAKTSLIAKAKDLKGKLLICQGAIDPTVLWQHSLNFIRECIKNNVQVDYFPYPRAEHNVRGRDRIHLKQKVSNYFDDYLK